MGMPQRNPMSKPELTPLQRLRGLARQSLGLVLAAAAALTAVPAWAGLDEAARNFRAEFKQPPGTQIEDSPFEGFYLLTGPDGPIRLFSEQLDFVGYGDAWEMKGESGRVMPVPPPALAALKSQLRARLKKHWLPVGHAGQGKDAIVVISAPNCGYCKLQNRDLDRHGAELGLAVHVLPELLGGNSLQFAAGVLCSADPTRAWSDALRGMLPRPAAECQKSRWAAIVRTHVFDSAGPGKIRIRTPATIRADGSVAFGWGDKASLAEMRQKLQLR
ncbi:hypothetical protein [Roseateles sp. LKC17W]|uniref:Thiol:disulfide interchange protein n=1 Tax=Pelomonas margarita TaxID=3299031 RepID=A0ABW7FJI0_9BURK